MSDATLYLHPGGYDTSGPHLLGRLAAGESFLRGYVRHASAERFHFWNIAGRPKAELDALLERIAAPAKAVTWIGRTGRSQIGETGVLNMPVPGLTEESWARRRVGSRSYAICGITHTTATARTMKTLAEMLIAPTEEYDALICTSNAVRHSVDTQLDEMRAYLGQEFGARRRPEPQRVTIPLGVNVDDFATTPEHRRAWRERLDIPEDAVVALFVGRFNVQGKMNPALMALALERATKRTGRPIYWVNSGWAVSEAVEAQFHEESRKLCPSVHYRHVDGRQPDVRFSIWSVADFFISFSDNIQETFGLTPVEAMAAGLPSVVSDWDGYRDTVRQGIDGFRVPTMAPPPGFGADLAYWYENNWLNYDNYVGATAQFASVDLFEAEKVIVALVENEDLRRLLGSQARAQARAVFDWKAIIPQYEALWAEQNARRLAAAPDPTPYSNPYHPDPFTLFQSYPTRHLTMEHRLMVPSGMDWAQADALLRSTLVGYADFHRPKLQEVEQLMAWLLSRPGATVQQALDTVPPERRSFMHRGLLWLARYAVIRILPAA